MTDRLCRVFVRSAKKISTLRQLYYNGRYNARSNAGRP
jgi:hypothetical protein